MRKEREHEKESGQSDGGFPLRTPQACRHLTYRCCSSQVHDALCSISHSLIGSAAEIPCKGEPWLFAGHLQLREAVINNTRPTTRKLLAAGLRRLPYMRPGPLYAQGRQAGINDKNMTTLFYVLASRDCHSTCIPSTATWHLYENTYIPTLHKYCMYQPVATAL